MNQNSKGALGVVMLLVTAMIWGSAFVAQALGMESLGAFSFGSIRTLLGGFVLLVFILIREAVFSAHNSAEAVRIRRRHIMYSVRKGIPVGIVFFLATNFQQYAFNYSTAGKIAFITALYILFVPMYDLFRGKKLPLTNWIAVVLGIVGLYFLCIGEEGLGGINPGDILTMICALLFTAHIIIIDTVAGGTDGVVVSCTQFILAGSVTMILMFIFESPVQIENVRSAAVPILYSGIMSCAVAYTFQIIGQKYVRSSVASLLMSMESVFAVLAAALVLSEVPTERELAGCVIMFISVILAQLPAFRRKEQPRQSR